MNHGETPLGESLDRGATRHYSEDRGEGISRMFCPRSGVPGAMKRKRRPSDRPSAVQKGWMVFIRQTYWASFSRTAVLCSTVRRVG